MQILLDRMARLTAAADDPGKVYPQPASPADPRPIRREPEPFHADHAAVHCADRAPDAQVRRQRWIAMSLRKRFDLAWLPEAEVARIATIQWRAEDEALVLTLVTGTRLIDHYDRIEVDGPADEVAIVELVACVKRRGWTRVKVHGSERFRADAARALLAAGIDVDDPPIPAEEVPMLLAPAKSNSPSGPTDPVPLR